VSTPLGLPVVTLTVEGMKADIKTALHSYLLGLSEEVAAAVDKVCTRENIQAVIDQEVASTLRVVIHEEVERYYRHGGGVQVVRDAVAQKLRDA